MDGGSALSGNVDSGGSVAVIMVLDGGSALSGNALCGNIDSGGSVAVVMVLDGGSALSGNALCGNVDSGGSVAVVMVVVVLLAAVVVVLDGGSALCGNVDSGGSVAVVMVVVVVLDGGSVPLKSVSTTRTPNKPRRISSGSYSHSYSFLCRVPGKRERRLRSL